MDHELTTGIMARAGGAGGSLGRAAVLVVAAALALGAAGCVATAGVGGEIVYGYPVARVDVVPVEIAAYPRVYYRGSYAYLVDGRWYYPRGRSWVVFREEPRELARYRTTLPPEMRRGRPREAYPAYPAPGRQPRRYYP